MQSFYSYGFARVARDNHILLVYAHYTIFRKVLQFIFIG